MRIYKTTEKIRKYALEAYYKKRDSELKRLKEWVRNNRGKRAEYYRNYRLTPKGHKATLKAIKKYESLNPDRKRAWTKARVIEKKPCQKCGNSKSQRHHPDISRPLYVEFLCPLHHKEIEMI